MFFLGVLLVIRTFMSIWIADVNGRVVKSIVDKSLKDFLQRVSLFLMTSWTSRMLVILVLVSRSSLYSCSQCHRPQSTQDWTIARRNLPFNSEGESPTISTPSIWKRCTTTKSAISTTVSEIQTRD